MSSRTTEPNPGKLKVTVYVRPGGRFVDAVPALAVGHLDSRRGQRRPDGLDGGPRQGLAARVEHASDDCAVLGLRGPRRQDGRGKHGPNCSSPHGASSYPL